MILKKRFRITAILFSLLLSVTLLFSSAVTVFAEGEQPAETFESYLATYGVDEKLIENGIIDGNLVDILNNPVYAATNEQKLANAKYLYEEVLGDKNREGTVLYYNKLLFVYPFRFFHLGYILF